MAEPHTESKQTWKSGVLAVVRLLIFALVVWGIVRAGRKALDDLATKQRELESRIAELEAELETVAADSVQAVELSGELE